MGLAMGLWSVGYSVAVVAAEVVAGVNCWAVAWSRRVADMVAGEDEESLDVAEEVVEEEEGIITVERRLEAEAAATDLEVATAVRGEAARRAGMERTIDRRAAMIERWKIRNVRMDVRGQEDNNLRREPESQGRAREIIQGGGGMDSRKGGKVDKYVEAVQVPGSYWVWYSRIDALSAEVLITLGVSNQSHGHPELPAQSSHCMG